MSNFARTVFYTGVTNNLENRVRQHRNCLNYSFTSKYQCFHLVYYEGYSSITKAIAREKQIKNWKREWKIKLIRSVNYELLDLAKEWE